MKSRHSFQKCRDSISQLSQFQETRKRFLIYSYYCSRVLKNTQKKSRVWWRDTQLSALENSWKKQMLSIIYKALVAWSKSVCLCGLRVIIACLDDNHCAAALAALFQSPSTFEQRGKLKGKTQSTFLSLEALIQSFGNSWSREKMWLRHVNWLKYVWGSF